MYSERLKARVEKIFKIHMPLDIYVLDNASDNESFHKFQTNVITGLYGLAMGHRAYINPDDYKNRDVKTQRVVKAISSIGKIIPLSWIIGWYEWVRKWNKTKNAKIILNLMGLFIVSHGSSNKSGLAKAGQ